ncbi:UPF0741 protein SSP2119-like [Ambystoma mexicanum]|uniref:UPF0741 protein SSP2119-like n=1 Tax=Ambystoma mexicanum TaxID=8296 RepID=UPI0037E8A2E4
MIDECKECNELQAKLTGGDEVTKGCKGGEKVTVPLNELVGGQLLLKLDRSIAEPRDIEEEAEKQREKEDREWTEIMEEVSRRETEERKVQEQLRKEADKSEEKERQVKEKRRQK